jgi:hypothetical protein
MARTVAWDIEDAKMAINNLNGTWGTNYDIPGVVSVQMEVEVKSGEQPGDGILYAVRSKVYAGTATVQFADLNSFQQFEVMMNQNRESSGDDMVFHQGQGDNFGYFSICGQTFIEGTGDFQIWVPRLIITENYSIGIADGEFVVPEISCRAIVEQYVTRNSGKPRLYFLRRNGTARDTQIPMLGVALTA